MVPAVFRPNGMSMNPLGPGGSAADNYVLNIKVGVVFRVVKATLPNKNRNA